MPLVSQLPKPHLDARLFGARCFPVLTDDSLFEYNGVRIAFTGREGGVSGGAFDSLNLASHVGDDPEAVAQNREQLLSSLGCNQAALVVPNQVHGDTIVSIESSCSEEVDAARIKAQAGADALVVDALDVAALLCFADCVPVIVVSPSGRFAVVHAGWRGVVAGIAGKAARELAQADVRASGACVSAEAIQKATSSFNAYLGPHIHVECFETGYDVQAQFVERFDSSVLSDNGHIDLAHALMLDLQSVGMQQSRIVDAGVCTVCSAENYYSYRASQGVCGRHGAFAVRQEI